MTPDDPRHGTNRGYAAGCHADCCRRAHMRHMKLWRMGHLQSRVPAIGSRRRIEALMALGWSRFELSRALGKREDYLAKTVRREWLDPKTAAAIEDLYERYSMKLAPYSAASQKVRARAQRLGYAPPLAWDDIDDPNAVPHGSKAARVPRGDVDEAVVIRVLSGEVLQTTAAEKREILRRWMAGGGSQRELCVRMGWKQSRYGSREDVA